MNAVASAFFDFIQLMFGLFRTKRHDPEAIARIVLRAATDPLIVSNFLKEFASSDDQIPRIIFSVVVYAYCWIRGWAISRNDPRVLDAYQRAAAIIISKFKDAPKLVRISDYVVSELELSELSLDLMNHFREQVPLKLGGDSFPEMMAELRAHQEAIGAQQMPFEILSSAIIRMRNERMVKELKGCTMSNLDFPDTLMTLSTTLYEQITGVTPLDFPRSPELLTEEIDISQPRRMQAILPLVSRLETELEAL